MGLSLAVLLAQRHEVTAITTTEAKAEKLNRFIAIEENPFVWITHGECMSDALALKAMIQEKFENLRVEISYVGAVIGAHSGPGTLALFFIGDGRE